jgi:hypothetical protein
VSRGTWDAIPGSRSVFAYGAVTLCGGTFQNLRLTERFVTPRPPREGVRIDPATPAMQRSHAYTHSRFRLFPVRSPLLGESRLLSLPGGTEMVHFPPLAPPSLCIQKGVMGHDSHRVSPFGHPRIKARSSSPGLIAAYDALHRLPAPRHPPYALSSLTIERTNSYSALHSICADA